MIRSSRSPARIRSPRTQRGGAVLIVTLMLFLALALLAFGINRRLLIEQRTAGNHARAAQAFEAAEAGLDWTQGMLNEARRIGADCKPTGETAAASFRARYLKLDRGSGAIATSSSIASCARNVDGWSCRCDGSRAPAADAAANIVWPTFTVSLEKDPRAGTVRVVATSTAAPDATVRAEATLALYSGLRPMPVAAITTRDATDIAPERFFATFFGIEKNDWRDQPAVARIACGGSCERDVQRAIDEGHDLIWIDGDAALGGALTLGSRERPIVLVAGGNLRMADGIAFNGAVYAASVALTADVTVHGAVLGERGDAGASASSSVVYDVDVLTALAHRTGSFVRLPGSWRDY